jgi:hypothetical protein
MNDVPITLTSDVALVLFELLHRWEDTGRIDPRVYPGETVALLKLSGALESELVQPFEHNYIELVAAARARLSPADSADL